jgi:hypothetical protein
MKTVKNLTLVLYENSSLKRRVIKRIQTKSQNKFTRRLKLIPDEFYVFLKVSYVDGGWNDGFYQNQNSLMLAYKAFTEQ